MDAVPVNLKLLRAMEFIALFVLLPGIVAMRWLPIPIIPLLLVAALGCAITLVLTGFPRHDWLRWRAPAAEVRRVLLIFAIAAPFLIALVWWLRPANLFAFPRERTRLWLLVMVLYPLLSVYPQEIVFRAFFFRRYRVLFGEGAGLILVGAVAFGWAHITFHNWVAVLLTLLGGLLFARTYHRTQALLFVAMEHALYGCFVFTVGYGHYLVDGTMRLAR
jgi:membrane protease YdiL (CAAX protease family)